MVSLATNRIVGIAARLGDTEKRDKCCSSILAGAAAVGVGTLLIPTESVEKHQAKRIHELALRFSKFVQEARLRVPPRKEISAAASRITFAKCDTP